MLEQDVIAAARRIAGRHRLDPAAFLAVAHVESGLRTHAMVDGRAEPLIRFEGHYFDRRLAAKAREKARRAGLASPVAGAVKNPAGQAARWALLERARAIDAQAADESVSWGIGQVMGAHWAWLGFASVGDLVALARSGVDGQLELMARFIVKAGLGDALARRDWVAFARGYNGPRYRMNRYDTRLARAWRLYAAGMGGAGEDGRNDAPLALGARGGKVRKVQALLVRHGHAITVDGIFGPRTRAAVAAFQRTHGLAPDGVVGPLTRRALGRGEPTPTFRSLWSRLVRLFGWWR